MNTKTVPILSTSFEWGAIIAGAIISLALSAILLQFGAAVGLSAATPFAEDVNIATWGVIASGIWLLWVQFLSSLSAGYVAGRLRNSHAGALLPDVELRDGIAGLTAWALSTVVTFVAVSASLAVAALVAAEAETQNVVAEALRFEQNTVVIFAFVASATSLVSGVAAWWAATMGGKHRDENTDFGTCFTFRK